ncbi:hypothetical protein [uncultured Methylobacterium sp.]|jgi:hypothetical protein|uniref:hypothetical protein n=1 Tax=uncultured Methylobacterium sp. TaxID=157278 RepID=UPI00261A99DB|nr:hypothetical protein [uncultured Methylobacterium sp.]
MAIVSTTLAALISSGVAGLADAVKTQKQLDGQIYTSVLSIVAVAAFRTGKSWGQGDTADVKDQKFNNAALEFENHYIAAGNHVFRDSEALPEFRNIKTALRKKQPEPITGAMIRAYKAAAKAAGLSKKEHAIAEVIRFSRKIFDDMTTNHAGAVRDLSDLEDAANVVKTVENFVRDNYGATVYALRAYFQGGKGDGKGSADPVEKATKALLEITDVAELAAIIDKLNARKAELAGSITVATTRVNPGRKSDNAAKAEGDAAKAA